MDTLRKSQFVNANIIGTHAYQVFLARKAALTDPAWASNLSDDQLQEIVDHQKAMLAYPTEQVRNWADGFEPPFKTLDHLWPILKSGLAASAEGLPVNVLGRFFAQEGKNVTPLQALALAGILQMMLDVNRDGDMLQDMFRHYQALGLPVYLGQIGLAAKTDKDHRALAEKLVPQFGRCPFEADAAALTIMFRKLFIWGRRYAGVDDKKTLAKRLARQAEVKALLPKLAAMPAQKIAIIGHSFTMNMHWASPSAFVPAAIELVRSVNDRVELCHWAAGGLNPARADAQQFFAEAKEFKPGRVLLVMAYKTPDDSVALEKMVAEFTSAGVEVAAFDQLRPTDTNWAFAPDDLARLSEKYGLRIIPVLPLWEAMSPRKRQELFSLDAIHMKESYHILMAIKWLEFLCAKNEV